MPGRNQILVDTDVMVDFLRGHPKAVALIHDNSAQIILSGIAAAELYAGVKGAKELATLDSLLSLFPERREEANTRMQEMLQWVVDALRDNGFRFGSWTCRRRTVLRAVSGSRKPFKTARRTVLRRCDFWKSETAKG